MQAVERPISLKKHRLTRLVERWRSTLGLDIGSWCEVMELGQSTYAEILAGRTELPLAALVRLAEVYDVSLELLMLGNIDFQSLAERYRGNKNYLPERYSIGAFSKRRTSRHILAYLEKFHGWEFKARVLRRFEMDDSVFSDPEGEMNILFLEDLCRYLSQLGFSDAQLHQMGRYSLIVNQGTSLAKSLAGYRDSESLHQSIFDELAGKYWDRNHEYQIQKLNSQGCLIKIKPTELVSDALKYSKVGNCHVCSARSGTLSSFAGYIQQDYSTVRHISCIHRGDSFCKDEIQFHPGL